MFRVVQDERDFLVINKDPNVPFHKESGYPGLPSVLRQQLGIESIFPVHRLDTMTSGLIVFAKDKTTASSLARQFYFGVIEKYYLAVSDRRPKKKQGLVKGDMVRSRRGTWKLQRSQRKPAVTRFVSRALGDGGLRLFILKPYTGRTHQLRVALKSIGAPAFGDPRYHPKIYNDREPDRGYLHACGLGFELSGERYFFECLPDRGNLFAEPDIASIVSDVCVNVRTLF